MERLNESNDRDSYENSGKGLLLSILRHVEADLDEGADIPSLQSTEIVTAPAETHGQHSVSSVTVRLVRPEYSLPSEDSIYAEYECEFQQLSENVDIRQLDDRAFENIHRVRFNWNDSENYSENYLTTALADNTILARMIWDFRHSRIGNQTSLQFIWSSKFSWVEIMQHLEYNTYDFEFNYVAMGIDSNDRHSTNHIMEHDPVQRRLALDGLFTVIITHQHHVDNGDSLECPICHETFCIVECVKELPCKHLYHPHCIRAWFSSRISCPIFRDEPVGPMMLNLGQ